MYNFAYFVIKFTSSNQIFFLLDLYLLGYDITSIEEVDFSFIVIYVYDDVY